MENIDNANSVKSIDNSDSETSHKEENYDCASNLRNIRNDDTESQGTENDLTIRMEVATCQGITVDKISAQVWRDAKLRIRKLLDRSLAQAEREQIAASLTDMCDRMETKNILETNIPRNVQLAIHLGTDAAIGSSANHSSAASVESFSDRLRERISEFNHGLVSLADGISRLKNKLLTIEYCAPSTHQADSIDVHVCRNIHKNFRRILQKESRFLRDELFAAKETIYRLERRSPGQPADNVEQQSTQLVPYHEYPPPFHPAAYFNIEHTAPLWPHGAAPPFMAYPAMWERMYAHPELSRQLQSYDSPCDLSMQSLLPQPVCTSNNAIAIQQPSSSWIPIGRSLTDSSQRQQEECLGEEKKR